MTTDPTAFRAGDIVNHSPSGEAWILANDEDNGRVMPCGWPESMAEAKDCTIVKAATDDERMDMLRKWSALGSDKDSRARGARWQLSNEKPTTETPAP